MKYAGMPAGMWLLFSGSFRKRLISVLKYDAGTAGEITSKAKKKYRKIIASVPEFEKGDRFRMNLVNCAMFSAFLLSMPARPTVEQATFPGGAHVIPGGAHVISGWGPRDFPVGPT